MLYLVIMELPEHHYRSEVVVRSLGGNGPDYELRCGFGRRKRCGDIPHNFENYGALLVLDGHGRYHDANGFACKVRSGDWLQRLPGPT